MCWFYPPFNHCWCTKCFPWNCVAMVFCIVILVEPRRKGTSFLFTGYGKSSFTVSRRKSPNSATNFRWIIIISLFSLLLTLLAVYGKFSFSCWKHKFSTELHPSKICCKSVGSYFSHVGNVFSYLTGMRVLYQKAFKCWDESCSETQDPMWRQMIEDVGQTRDIRSAIDRRVVMKS